LKCISRVAARDSPFAVRTAGSWELDAGSSLWLTHRFL